MSSKKLIEKARALCPADEDTLFTLTRSVPTQYEDRVEDITFEGLLEVWDDDNEQVEMPQLIRFARKQRDVIADLLSALEEAERALRFYADREAYRSSSTSRETGTVIYPMPKVMADRGQMARTALKEDSDAD